MVGYCGIAIEQIDCREEKEIGYRFDSKKFWGRGLATEAASAVVQYGFKQLKLLYILGIVERANAASIKALEKLGMEYKRETVFGGDKMDVCQVNCAG